jgi:arylsulfatase A-like enzyme
MSLLCGAPNVVLLSVDTLRADYLSCYGYEHPSSPHLDALAQEGMVFEDAVCEVPLTGPSFGSMFTSRYPRTTGATRNGLPVPEEIPKVTTRFKEAGYQTFCVQSNWTLKRKLSGLDQDFDIYDDDFREKRWGFLKGERYAEDVTRLALELLEKRDREKPFFAWVHYSDPHAPYENHPKFNVTGKRVWRLDQTDRVRAKYASEVAFTDHQIGRLLEALPEDTFVLFVADHGESLYEHDYLGHGRRIHQTGLHIPFIMRGPGIEPGRSTAPVRGIDVGPTLLGMAGLPPLEGALGINLIADVVPETRDRVAETYGGAVPDIPGVRDIMEDAGPMRQGALLGGWKLILGDTDPELFYLPDDPGELNNLYAEQPEKAQALEALIETWSANHESVEGGAPELDQDDLDALKSLGYIE